MQTSYKNMLVNDFLLKCHTISRLLNMFYNEPSPYFKPWMESIDQLPVAQTTEPDIGMPTPDPKMKPGFAAINAERKRRA